MLNLNLSRKNTGLALGPLLFLLILLIPAKLGEGLMIWKDGVKLPWDVVTLTIFLTEITSNTACRTIILPVTASLAAALGMDPLGLMIAAAMSSSLAFMMNIFCIAIITLFVTFKTL